MAGFTNPDTVHRASVGAIAPAAWGDTVNDDINFLASSGGNEVATNETTTALTYGDLTTVGPSQTVTTGANALVIVGALMSTTVAGDGALMSVAVSDATTLAAGDTNAAQNNNTNSLTAVAATIVTGLNAGSNTFTAKYRAAVGGTASFSRRWIIVMPLP